MGESSPDLCLSFNCSFRISPSTARFTTCAGAPLLRTVLDRTGLIDFLASRISDERNPDQITHSLAELLRTPLLLGALGQFDQSAADLLRHDPALRAAVADRRGLAPFRKPPPGPLPRNPPEPLALPSQPSLSRNVTRLSSRAHREVVREGLLHLAFHNRRRFGSRNQILRVTVDIDSWPVEVFGEQEGSEYNGHYHARIFHPLVAYLEETGDLLDVELRAGKVHTAKGVRKFIDQLLRRLSRLGHQVELCLRMDAGFPSGKLLRKLEATGVRYLARIRHMEALDELVGPYLAACEAARNGKEQLWTFEAQYQAKSWKKTRRVVVAIQDTDPEQKLNWFWLISSQSAAEQSGPELVQDYRQRGRFEARLGEWNSVVELSLASSNRPKRTYRQGPVKRRAKPIEPFAQNEATVLLGALVYGLMNTARLYREAQQRREKQAEGERTSGLSLKRLREEVLRVPGRLVMHARRAWLKVENEVMAQFQALEAEVARSS